MESDFKGVMESSVGQKLNGMVTSTFSRNSEDNDAHNNNKNIHDGDDDDDSDCDDEERENFTRSEVKKMFDLVDKDKSGNICVDELSNMLKQLGRELSEEDFKRGFEQVDSDSSGQIDFDEFYEWYKLSNKN